MDGKTARAKAILYLSMTESFLDKSRSDEERARLASSLGMSYAFLAAAFADITYEDDYGDVQSLQAPAQARGSVSANVLASLTEEEIVRAADVIARDYGKPLPDRANRSTLRQYRAGSPVSSEIKAAPYHPDIRKERRIVMGKVPKPVSPENWHGEGKPQAAPNPTGPRNQRGRGALDANEAQIIAGEARTRAVAEGISPIPGTPSAGPLRASQGPLGGTYRLTVEGVETDPIPFNSSAEEIQAAIDRISGKRVRGPLGVAGGRGHLAPDRGARAKSVSEASDVSNASDGRLTPAEETKENKKANKAKSQGEAVDDLLDKEFEGEEEDEDAEEDFNPLTINEPIHKPAPPPQPEKPK